MKVIIGIDNGSSGSYGILTDDDYFFGKVPTFKELNYQKTKAKNITRVDVDKYKELLEPFCKPENYVKAFIERPMVNPARFNASLSAVRCLEATLIVLESLDISINYLCSTPWQKDLLPTGVKGPALKTASKDIGCRLFPKWKELIIKQKDADGILIAEYARKNNL